MLMRSTLFLIVLLFSPFSHASEGSYLYKQHCAACHGQYGERHAWSVTRPIRGWSTDAIEQALLSYKNDNRNRYGYGAYMHPQVSKYTPEKIKAIADYISSLGSISSRPVSQSQ